MNHQQTTLNYQAFDRKIPLKQVASYAWIWLKEILAKYGTLSKVLIFILGFLFVLFTVSILLTVVNLPLLFLDSLRAEQSGTSAIPQILSWLFSVAVFLGFGYFFMKLFIVRRMHLQQFCKDNGFDFLPKLDLGEQSGVLFKKGHSKKASNGIRGYLKEPFILFDYQYTTGSGKNSKTHRFGVARMKLKRKFPHILLDNKRDSSVRGFEFASSQQLELEGGFNKHFNVYGPKEYEIEVLQVLNPAVMQDLLDIPEPIDIEIIGDDLYIYNDGNHYKKQVIVSIFTAISDLMASTASVQKSFSMPTQIGDYKPILKRSKWPMVITVGTILIIVFVYFAASLITGYVKGRAGSLQG